MIETVVALVSPSLSKYSARMRAKVALYHMAFCLSRFQGKKDRIGQVTGPQNPGRLFH
jgi:hypothetical protein